MVFIEACKAGRPVNLGLHRRARLQLREYGFGLVLRDFGVVNLDMMQRFRFGSVDE
jgi:hypothetical protein